MPMAAPVHARGALACCAAGVVLGAIVLLLLRLGREALDDGAVLTAVLALGLASGAAASPAYARRWGRMAWPRATAALAVALALGRPLWEKVPLVLSATWAPLPTRIEQRIAGAIVLLPLAALPAGWLARASVSALASVPRELNQRS
jgi:hypothetical protein